MRFGALKLLDSVPGTLSVRRNSWARHFTSNIFGAHVSLKQALYKSRTESRLQEHEFSDPRRVPRSTVLEIGRPLLQKCLNALAAIGKRKAAVVQRTFNF